MEKNSCNFDKKMFNSDNLLYFEVPGLNVDRQTDYFARFVVIFVSLSWQICVIL
jgi:hypothetical protein